MSTRLNTGASIFRATNNPTGTGNWCWLVEFRINSYASTFTQGPALVDNSLLGDVVGVDTDESATDSLDFFVNNLGTGFSSAQLATGGYTGYIQLAVAHTSGANTVEYWSKKESDSSLLVSGSLSVTNANLSVLVRFVLSNSQFSDPSATTYARALHYSRVLTPTEILNQFNSATVLSTTNLVGQPDVANSGAPGVDLSATAVNYTVNGTPVSDAATPSSWGGAPSADSPPLQRWKLTPQQLPEEFRIGRLKMVLPSGSVVVQPFLFKRRPLPSQETFGEQRLERLFVTPPSVDQPQFLLWAPFSDEGYRVEAVQRRKFPFAAIGGPTFSSSGSAALSVFAASASGLVVFSATVAAAMASFAASATGVETFSSSGSAAFSAFACTAAATETFTCSGTAAAQPFDSAGNGAQGTVFTSTCTAAVQSFACSAAGTNTPTFSCSGSAQTSSFAITGSGLESFSGTASVACLPFGVAASGLETFTSSGGAALVSFGAAGNAAQGTVFTSVASAALAAFAASATTLEAFLATGQMACSPFGLSGAGLETFTTSGGGACSRFSVVGAGDVNDGSISCSGSAGLAAFSGNSLAYQSFATSAEAAMRAFSALGYGPGRDTSGLPLYQFIVRDFEPIRIKR